MGWPDDGGPDVHGRADRTAWTTSTRQSASSARCSGRSGSNPDDLARIEDAIGSPDDDGALLLLSLDLHRLPFEVELPADPTALQGMRRRLRAWLANRGVDPEEAADVVLAVSEACNNAIEHGYGDNGGGPVKVNLAATERRVASCRGQDLAGRSSSDERPRHQVDAATDGLDGYPDRPAAARVILGVGSGRPRSSRVRTRAP